MEETLVEVRSGTARVLADKKTVARRLDRLRKQATDWEQKAELALGKDREDLAKAALVEKANTVATIEILSSDLAKLDETLDKLTMEIEQLQSKLNEVRARQKTILMRTRAAKSRVTINQRLHDNAVDNAIDKFEYYEKKLDMMEGQVDSMNIAQTSLQSEFDDLERQEKINEELEKLKIKLKK